MREVLFMCQEVQTWWWWEIFMRNLCAKLHGVTSQKKGIFGYAAVDPRIAVILVRAFRQEGTAITYQYAGTVSCVLS